MGSSTESLVSVHPYCARLHAQIHMPPRHASSARAKY